MFAHKGVALQGAKSKVVALRVVIMVGNLMVVVNASAFPPSSSTKLPPLKFELSSSENIIYLDFQRWSLANTCQPPEIPNLTSLTGFPVNAHFQAHFRCNEHDGCLLVSASRITGLVRSSANYLKELSVNRAEYNVSYKGPRSQF